MASDEDDNRNRVNNRGGTIHDNAGGGRGMTTGGGGQDNDSSRTGTTMTTSQLHNWVVLGPLLSAWGGSDGNNSNGNDLPPPGCRAWLQQQRQRG